MRGAQRSIAIAAFLLNAAATADKLAYRHFEGSVLTQGRVVWLANCEACHGYGTAGAPMPMYPDEWRERLKQPKQTLYRHAIEGFYGPDDTVMPARGGNDHLSDDDVRMAVDYMTELATYYLKPTE